MGTCYDITHLYFNMFFKQCAFADSKLEKGERARNILGALIGI